MLGVKGVTYLTHEDRNVMIPWKQRLKTSETHQGAEGVPADSWIKQLDHQLTGVYLPSCDAQLEAKLTVIISTLTSGRPQP